MPSLYRSKERKIIMKKIIVALLTITLFVPFSAGAVVKRDRGSQKKAAKEAAVPALKKVIAVADFDLENVAWGTDVATNLGDILVDKLVNTGKFIVVERDRKSVDLTLSRAAEREQAAKQSGLSRGKGADAGKAMAAQALFVGMITGAGKGSSFGGGGAGWGSGGFGLGGMGISSNKVSVVVRWYDTTTLEIKGSHQCSSTQSSFSFAGGGFGDGGLGAGGGNLRSTLDKTFSRALDKCVAWIVKNMENLPWEGKVINAKAGKIYINAGADSGVKSGDIYKVYKAGEELVDPDSGAILGVEETLAGEIQISKAMPKYSVGEILSGSGFKSGDIIRQQ